MSVDRSLRIASSLARHRNVLTRAERIAQLLDEGAWDTSQGALGLPKVSHRKAKSKKKEKAVAATAEGEAATETETPAT